MLNYPALAQYQFCYYSVNAGDMGMPLRVVLSLVHGARIAGYDPVNLDNMLARAVVDEATHSQMLPESPEPYVLPVPLRCLWRSADGLPLWAATPFHPTGEAVNDVAYWHKRIQSGRWTGTKSGTYSIWSTNGRFMERRVPLPTVVCDTWEAEAIGDPREIARLLVGLSFIGKRRTNGFGEVKEWRVEPGTFALVHDGLLTRPMPAEAAHLLGAERPVEQPAPVGWTPPQWMPRLFRPGWWTGTRVEMDYFEAVDAL